MLGPDADTVSESYTRPGKVDLSVIYVAQNVQASFEECFRITEGSCEGVRANAR